MSTTPSLLARNAARLAALGLIAGAYAMTRLPSLGESERRDLAARFAFERFPLPEPPGLETHLVREVHPDLREFAGWISSVGAAIALDDLDGDGLPNDACRVEPRADRVIIAPVPGTGDRYAPFALPATPGPHDPRTVAPMGSLGGDFNEDGRTDVLVYFWGRPPVVFLRRAEGAGAPLTAASYVPVDVAAAGERWYTNAATSADLDGDGHVDLVIGNYFPDGARVLDPSAEDHAQMQDSMSRAFNGGHDHLLLWRAGADALADAHADTHAQRPSRHGSAGSNPADPGAARIAPDGAIGALEIAVGRVEPGRSRNSEDRPGRGDRSAQDSHTGAPAQAFTFVDASSALEPPVGRGWTLAVGAADLDGDLLPEIYIANDFGPDRLLHNRSRPGELRFALLRGERGWTTPASKALGHDSFKGMGVDFGDVNDDGLLDIYVSNIAEEFALEESHFLFESTGRTDEMQRGVAPYVDRSEPRGVSRSGWGWETRLADFDNDGVLEAVQATGFLKGRTDRWPELHELAMGNDTLVHRPTSWPHFAPGDELSGWEHNPFFVRSASGRYFDLAADVGLGGEMVTRGIATADVDGDGDLDLAIANQWETSYFYRNDAPAPGAFLGLDLVVAVRGTGTAAGARRRTASGWRPAIGASATVTRPDGRRLVAQVDGGNGHSGARSHQLHFGLGDCAPEARATVDIRWRDGSGEIRERTLSLAPGWHAVVLDAAGGELASGVTEAAREEGR